MPEAKSSRIDSISPARIGNAMIRLRPGRTRRALDHVKPAHAARIGVAPFGKVSRVAREARESRRKGNQRRAKELRPHSPACIASPPAGRTPASRLRAHCRGSPAHTHATWPADKPSAANATDQPAWATRWSASECECPHPARPFCMLNGARMAARSESQVRTSPK